MPTECSDLSMRHDNMENKWLNEFQYAFWDTDLTQLDAECDSDYIIVRLYCKGGIRGIRAAEKYYSKEQISHAAMVRRDLNPIAANYLQSVCGLAREEMAYYRTGRRDAEALWKY